jgi:2-polyprenyl-6-methoxyphenol hydroxylase-like FAD-dependent oxidoreductase
MTGMTHDVIIAGGGPVGLFLACDLRQAGVSVLVLEKAESSRSPLKAGWMGMRSLNFQSVEAFYRRGLLDDVRAGALAWMDPIAASAAGTSSAGTGDADRTGQPSETPSAFPRRFAGHFAGIMLDMDRVDFSGWKYVVPGPSASGGIISLETLELMLADRAVRLGVDLRYGTAVTDLTEDDAGILVGAGNQSFRGRWLVGCDGGRSIVRKLAGFDFEGTEPEFTGYTAAVTMADPEKLRPGFNLTDRGLYTVGPGPGRIGVLEFDGAAFDRTQTVTLDNMQAVLRRVSGTDVTLTELHVASTYTDRARQATTYRKGSVLLAGDAAHVHSPLGGQGLNTGVGDAMNLGWKLAATIQGWAPDDLLDSYTHERHPVGAWVLDWTRAQVAIMRPEPHARAMASVMREMLQTRDATTYMVSRMSGVELRYDLGSDHPLIGRSAPDFAFDDGTRLGDHLRTRKAVLLDFTHNDNLQRLGARYSDRLVCIAHEPADNKGLAAAFVRPDGFVAAAAATDVDVPCFEKSIERWLGA